MDLTGNRSVRTRYPDRLEVPPKASIPRESPRERVDGAPRMSYRILLWTRNATGI